MKWFEQSATEYDSLVGKQILKEFGAAGYGAYVILKQVFAQNMNDDMTEWGFVSKTETKETLAVKCCLPTDEFRRFLSFCDERFIFEKRNGRLFCPSILEEKNNYAKKVVLREKKKSTDTSEKTECTDSTYSTDTNHMSVVSDVTTQHNTVTTTAQKQEHIPAPKVAVPKKIPSELQEIVKYLEEKTGVKIPNFGKQASAWKAMQKAEYSGKSIRFTIDRMSEDPYWQEQGFDLTNVLNNIAKIKQKYQRGSP